MAKQTNFFMTATFCIFTQGKTNQTFSGQQHFAFLHKVKQTKLFHDSNILHFYTWQNKPNF